MANAAESRDDQGELPDARAVSQADSQQRNKPKEPPKAPEAAPFFLPTISGLETRFDLSAAQPEAEDSSKRLAPLQMLESDFTRRLAAEDAGGDCKWTNPAYLREAHDRHGFLRVRESPFTRGARPGDPVPRLAGPSVHVRPCPDEPPGIAQGLRGGPGADERVPYRSLGRPDRE